MALLYVVDDLVTRACQLIARWITTKLGLSPEGQFWILSISTLVANFLFTQEIRLPSWMFVAVLPIVVLETFAKYALSFLWEGVHRWVDLEEAINPHKKYSQGYLAWSCAVLGGFFLLLTIKASQATYILLLFAGLLLVEAYFRFSERKTLEKKGDKVKSPTLLKLIERWKKSLRPSPTY